ALAIVLAQASSATCGSDGLQSFSSDYASAFCHRAFQCCATADLPLVAHATSEATCVTMMRNTLDKNGAQAIAMGLVRFDAAAARQCLAAFQSACSAIFDAKFGRISACADVFVGAVPLGGPCDDDFVCESNDCESQSCVTRPPSP